jgi:hypothetical protein
MADPQIQQLLQAFGQLTGAAGNSKASLTAASQSMARLRDQMQRGTGTVQAQTAALQSSISQFSALDTATQKSASGQQLLAQQAQAASQIFKEAAGSMTASVLKGGLAEAISYTTKQIYTAIGSYQEGASGIQTAFNMQNAAIESQIKILDRLSSGATVAAETLALIPNPYARIAAGAAGLVAGLAGLGKGATELEQQGLQALQKEMTISSMSFDIMNKSGALFAGGMTQMRETSGALQLNLNEFSAVVGQNKKDLADFGGSVVGGIKKVHNVGKAFDSLRQKGFDYRKELERAGYSQQEQTDGLIDYMEMLNKTGQLRKMSDTQIAVAGTEYLKNLKAISAFTGEDAKQAQARAREAASQGAVRVKLERMGGEATAKFVALSAKMGPDMTKALSEMIHTGGQVVNKDLNILLANSPTRKKIMDQVYTDLNAGTISAGEASKRYEQLVKDNAENLKAEGDSMAETFGTVSGLGRGLDSVTKLAEGQQDLANKGLAAREAEVAALGDTSVQLRKTITEGIDPFRNSVVEAERQMRSNLPRMMELLNSYVVEYTQKMSKDEKGPAGMLKKQQEDLIKAMQAALKMPANSTTTGITQPGGTASKLANSVFEGLLGVVNDLDKVVGKMGVAMDRILQRRRGSPGEANQLTENFGKGTLIEAHGNEGIFTEQQLLNMAKGARMAGSNAGVTSAMQQTNEAMSSLLGSINEQKPDKIESAMQQTNETMSSLLGSINEQKPDQLDQTNLALGQLNAEMSKLKETVSGQQPDIVSSIQQQTNEEMLSLRKTLTEQQADQADRKNPIDKIMSSFTEMVKKITTPEIKVQVPKMELPDIKMQMPQMPQVESPEVNVQMPQMPQSDNLQNIGTQLTDSFTQSMALFQQQRLQAETAKPEDAEDLNKVLETITNSMSTLTNQITDGNKASQDQLSNLLQALNDKSILEDLLSAMQDNVDYSKRIADNIA